MSLSVVSIQTTAEGRRSESQQAIVLKKRSDEIPAITSITSIGAISPLECVDDARQRYHASIAFERSQLLEYASDLDPHDGALEIGKDEEVRTSCYVEIFDDDNDAHHDAAHRNSYDAVFAEPTLLDPDTIYANSVDRTTQVLAGWQLEALDDDVYHSSIDTTHLGQCYTLPSPRRRHLSPDTQHVGYRMLRALSPSSQTELHACRDSSLLPSSLY